MFAALDNVPATSCSHISTAIFFSIAAPIKDVYTVCDSALKALLIRPNAVLPVFQCSSAPAGSMPPLSSPNIIAFSLSETIAPPL